ncbi:beta-lactamase family protein [Herbidospora galbida]|uniref:Beta-lactamase family protein n=1 Tax=Herbidospora galbida TaxID=2575442 RepID=A0A4U3MF99_9ACTN|nr:serine hydrolase domain-containing protein [Herbidospora galbida]TKK86577.1 beta-lactamase family protein [Herbidospora galbida]
MSTTTTALQAAIDELVGPGILSAQLRLHDRGEVWVGTAGVARLGEPEGPPADGRFRIGSATKTFAATAVLGLVAEGRFGLDDPVAGHLPGFDLDPRITVRMLLQHTSGVFAFTGEYFEDGTVVPGIPVLGREWVDARFTTYPPEELARFALAKPARFEPGADWNYSNTNYVLARLLVEKVTGRSLAEETHRLILGPLGLTNTFLPETDTEIPGPHAHAYYRYEEDGVEKTVDVTRQNPSWISTGGDMISTTEDLATFVSALMAGRLLPAPLLDEMRTPHPKAGYGLGLFVLQDGALLNHNGGLSGYATIMYSTPDGGTTLTGSLTFVDDAAMSQSEHFQKFVERILTEAFSR